jgi:hypothetical protein
MFWVLCGKQKLSECCHSSQQRTLGIRPMGGWHVLHYWTRMMRDQWREVVCCDCHQLVQLIKESQSFSCNFCIFLSNGMKLHYVSQHILSKMLMHQHVIIAWSSVVMVVVQCFLKISWVLKPNIFFVWFPQWTTVFHVWVNVTENYAVPAEWLKRQDDVNFF